MKSLILRFLFTLLLLLTSFSQAYAAIAATAVWEVRSLAAGFGGGCFDASVSAPGTDRSQSSSLFLTYTDLVAATTTTITSAGNPFDSTSPGNCLRITSGTNWTVGVYEILSVAGSTATVDRAIATLGATGGNGNQGGALATLAGLATLMVSGNRAWIQADGTYSISSGVTFNHSNTPLSYIQGYTTTRGDNGQATIQASAGITLITLSSGQLTFANFILDANSQANGICINATQVNIVVANVECKNTSSATAAVTAGNVRQLFYRVYIHGLASSGSCITTTNDDIVIMYLTCGNLTGSAHNAVNLGRAHCFYCIVFGNAVAGSDGFTINGGGNPVQLDHCVVYNVARDAIRITSVTGLITITNCVLSTATNGINNSSGTTLTAGTFINDYNFTYNMSGSVVSGITAGSHSVTLSADPFTAAGTPDFTLNNTTNGGASVRAAGFPSSLGGITGTGYPDAGVLQHQDSGGGSTVGGFVAP